MDGANKRFMHGKEQWLQNHLILYNVANAAANPWMDPLVPANPALELPVYDFDLRKLPDIQDSTGAVMKAYALTALTHLGDARAVGALTHALRAYFLPWGTNQTYRGRLGANADFFFTPTLNGCTFAADGAGATPMVAHSNHVNVAAQTVNQAQINADLAGIYGAGGPGRIIHRNAYKAHAVGTEDYRVTIIGIRGAAGWRFYYQRYQTDINAAGTGLLYTALNRAAAL